jgi:uncharacterized protein YbaP (TraB family)
MLWSVHKRGKISHLVGTVHFFPFSFKKAMTRLIAGVDRVFLEGPLDEGSRQRVVAHGTKGDSRPLLSALDTETISEINSVLVCEGGFPQGLNLYLPLFQPQAAQMFPSCIEGLQPWMAFFQTWVKVLQQRGWDYSMDLEAYHVALKLAKPVFFLETIEEQLKALDGIPLERIAAFFKDIGNWDRYLEEHLRFYLNGDLDGWPGATMGFPTRCASILDQRDPILFERMKAPLAEGKVAVFVGIPHVRAIRPLLMEDGFDVVQITP